METLALARPGPSGGRCVLDCALERVSRRVADGATQTRRESREEDEEGGSLHEQLRAIQAAYTETRSRQRVTDAGLDPIEAYARECEERYARRLEAEVVRIREVELARQRRERGQTESAVCSFFVARARARVAGKKTPQKNRTLCAGCLRGTGTSWSAWSHRLRARRPPSRSGCGVARRSSRLGSSSGRARRLTTGRDVEFCRVLRVCVVD